MSAHSKRDPEAVWQWAIAIALGVFIAWSGPTLLLCVIDLVGRWTR